MNQNRSLLRHLTMKNSPPKDSHHNGGLHYAMDDRYIIDTPENIAFAYDVAGIGSRFLAAIIDTFLLLVIQAALGIVGYMIYLVADNGTARSIILAVLTILSFVFLWGFYIVFELLWN